MSQEIKGQKTWLDYQRPDLRSIYEVDGLDTPNILVAGNDAIEALAILELALGFDSEVVQEIEHKTPIDVVKVLRELLPHIVEKRMDARERYTNFAIQTLLNPFEVWRIEYVSTDDGQIFRLAFIGVFKGKRQMLVTVDTREDVVLWNFMHQEAKSLNKHRHGELIYSR